MTGTPFSLVQVTVMVPWNTSVPKFWPMNEDTPGQVGPEGAVQRAALLCDDGQAGLEFAGRVTVERHRDHMCHGFPSPQ